LAVRRESLFDMNDGLIARARYLVVLWLAGSVMLAAVTWLCFGVGLNFATAAFAYLIVIVLLSLLDSLISSIVFSVVAVGCLNFFFVPPLFTLQIDYAQDTFTLAAFAVTSIVVTTLVRRVRQLGDAQRDQATASRKELEEALRHGEHRYHNLFRAMAASFWEIDFSAVGTMLSALRKSGVQDFRAYFVQHPEFVRDMMRNSRVIDVNEQTVATFGRGDKEEMLTSVEPFWPEESTHVFAESILASIAGKPHYATECKLRRIDGTLFDGLFTASFPPATYGKGTLMVGVIDVTLRKQAEVGFEQSQQRYRNLFQAMAVSFWELDFTEVGAIIHRLRASGVSDLKQYFRDNPNAIREVMRATRVVDVNDQTVSLFRIDRADALTTEPFWPEESWQDYVDAILSSLDHQLNFSVETRLRKFDGTVFDAHFTVWYSDQNRSVGLAGVLDITERVRAFADLTRSEQRYRNVFHYMPMSLTQIDASKLMPIYRRLRQEGVTDLKSYLDRYPDFLWTITDAMEIDEVNDHNARMFGAPNQQAMHGPITRYWSARPDTIRRALESLFRGDASYQEETQVVRFDGRTIDVLFSVARPAPVTDKSLVGFLDITALKQAHAAVEQSEERYRSLFHYMPIPLWRMNSTRLRAVMDEVRAEGVTDLEAHMDAHPDFLRRAMDAIIIEEANRSTVELFGAGNEGDVRVPVERYWRASPDTFRRVLASRYRGEPVFEEETKMTTLDGRVVEGTFRAAFPEELSKLGISLNAFVDATDRNRAQQMLQRVQADFAHAARVSVLGELTASIAHEVNQPLAAITTNGQAGLRWLNRAEPNVTESLELMKRMVADARRAADIISRVRDMATRRPHQRIPVSLHQIIDESLLFLGHEIQARNVLVALNRASQLPDVLADRTQLQQVVVNLAVNAMQAMATQQGKPPMLGIRTMLPEPATVCCVIEDSGPGVDPAHLEHLFESFFTTKESGMGMGLPICRSIIEAHGGRVQADNRQGGGARFSFFLPAAGGANQQH
jgi:signal transduction histidine kinase